MPGRSAWEAEVGVSVQYGGIYNRATGDTGHHWAAAVHLDGRVGPWHVQLQAARYAYRPRNPPGVGDEAVQGALLGAANLIPAEGGVYAVNFARDLAVRWGPIESITLYNDFSILRKRVAGWDDSWLNTFGASFEAGPVLAYAEVIMGRNATFLGPYSKAFDDSTRMLQGTGERETRFNINLGYYF